MAAPRKGCKYIYSHSLFDFEHRAHDGEVVEVVELPGCGRMPSRVRHVKFADGTIGFVSSSTLSPRKSKARA